MKAALEEFEGLEWEVAEIQLVRSVLGGGTPRYTVLRSWPLDGPVGGPVDEPGAAPE